MVYLGLTSTLFNPGMLLDGGSTMRINTQQVLNKVPSSQGKEVVWMSQLSYIQQFINEVLISYMQKH